jgi:ectoine hydroxylase-related dioxygenase (phytanoyl-CoA dioxygenase family)
MSQQSIRKIDGAASLDSVLEIIDRDGAIILKGLLTNDALLDLRRELEPIFEGTGYCVGLFYGGSTKRIHSLVRKSPACRAMIMEPAIIQIMNSLLLPHCDSIQLNLTQGIQIWPGERAQVPHRDDSMFPVAAKPCEFMVNAMWAYSDFSRENGATFVVPGSHKWEDKERLPAESEIVKAEMAAGEVLIYLGSVIHGGGENRCIAPRTGIAISYCLGWLRQSENQYFAAPPTVARHFSAELQNLLGYSVQRPNLGLFEGNEPNLLLQDAKGEDLVTRDWLTPRQNDLLRRYLSGEDLVAA